MTLKERKINKLAARIVANRIERAKLEAAHFEACRELKELLQPKTALTTTKFKIVLRSYHTPTHTVETYDAVQTIITKR